MKSLFFSLLCWLALSPSLSNAEESEVLIITPVFVNMIEEDGSGVYQHVLKEAALRSGIQYREQVYPLKRALINFINHQGLCIFGLQDQAVEGLGEENLVHSFPVGVAKLHLFTAKGSLPITSAANLSGLNVGGTLGYEDYYQRFLDQGMNLELEGNERSNIRKLQAGRIDAMLGFLPDYRRYLSELSYDPSFPLLVVNDLLSCHNNDRGRDFVERISAVLREMQADGSLNKIMGSYYMGSD